jgi:hypothetical protein
VRRGTIVLLAALALIGPACGPSCGVSFSVKSAPSPAIGDSCVVGRWVDQLTDDAADWTFNGQDVHVTGMQGFTATFSTDGTEILNWAESQPLVGTYQGRELKIVLGGSYTFHGVTAAHGRITRPAGSGSFTAKFYLAGVPQPTISAHVDAGYVSYTCSRSALVWLSSSAQPATTTFTRG